MRSLDRSGRHRLALGALGLLSAALYAAVAFGLRFANDAGDVATFLAVFGALFGLCAAAAWSARRALGGRRTLALVLGFAVLFRLILLCAGLPRERPLEALAEDLSGRATGYEPFLIYDNDVWRYLWDGHVGAAGVSPYAVTPAQVAALAEEGEAPYPGLLADELWWDVLDNVSFQGHASVYPPLAQLAFRLAHRLAPGSVFAWKLLVVAADLATCWGLVHLLAAVGRRRTEVVWWAWNPLVLGELAGSGHADALMIALLTWAVALAVRGRELTAHAALGASVLAKLGSAVLLPLFLRRTRPRSWLVLAAVLAAGFLLLAREAGAVAGGLAVYGRDWVFNSGPWAALRIAAGHAGADDPALWAHVATKTTVLAAALWVAWRGGRSPAAWVRAAFVPVALVAWLNPAVMPWYLLWALPLAVAAGCRSWLLLTGLSLLSYLFYVDGVERAWWLVVEHGLFAVALGVEVARGRGRPATSLAAA